MEIQGVTPLAAAGLASGRKGLISARGLRLAEFGLLAELRLLEVLLLLLEVLILSLVGLSSRLVIGGVTGWVILLLVKLARVVVFEAGTEGELAEGSHGCRRDREWLGEGDCFGRRCEKHAARHRGE